MEQYKDIKISDFTYELPEERIAKYPLPNRDESQLLIWDKGKINKDIFKNISRYLPENSMLIFNNTRVIHARINFQKETGSKIEIFCLEPEEPSDYQLAFAETKKVTWNCMVGNAKKWKSGVLTKLVETGGKSFTLNARKIAQAGNSFSIEFTWTGNITFSEVIQHAGILPIPPYLKRETEDKDEETYQTVYAKIEGSVAAPTAGLHFTEEVLSNLSLKNIEKQEITLHVGAGTFQPVKSESISGHKMHNEQVEIGIEVLRSLLENPDNLIAVGTTSVRSIESLYWLGLQLEENRFNPYHPEILQWEPYTREANISAGKALQNIIYFLVENGEKAVRFSTQIIIVPGYDFKFISGMVTNFHQPQSTLLLLIAAFLGNDWQKVYDFAMNNDFRFLSYGDSNLYLK